MRFLAPVESLNLKWHVSRETRWKIVPKHMTDMFHVKHLKE